MKEKEKKVIRSKVRQFIESEFTKDDVLKETYQQLKDELSSKLDDASSNGSVSPNIKLGSVSPVKDGSFSMNKYKGALSKNKLSFKNPFSKNSFKNFKLESI